MLNLYKYCKTWGRFWVLGLKEKRVFFSLAFRNHCLLHINRNEYIRRLCNQPKRTVRELWQQERGFCECSWIPHIDMCINNKELFSKILKGPLTVWQLSLITLSSLLLFFNPGREAHCLNISKDLPAELTSSYLSECLSRVPTGVWQCGDEVTWVSGTRALLEEKNALV